MIFYHNTVTTETTVPSGANTHWLNNLLLGQNTAPAIFSVTTLTRPTRRRTTTAFVRIPMRRIRSSGTWWNPAQRPLAAAIADAAPGGGRGAAARPRRDAGRRSRRARSWAALQPGQFKTLAEYAQATGQDRHSVLVDYDVFVNVPKLDRDPKTVQRLYKFKDYDFRLKPGSAAIDKGVVIPNVNDGFTGTAPDLGALEAGQPLPTYGPRP